MKKLIILSMIVALMTLGDSAFAPAYCQAPSSADKPTFYHLVPGTYVNGWPRFTVHYPKDWVEQYLEPFEVFRVVAPGRIPYLSLSIVAGHYPFPLDKVADTHMKVLQAHAADVTLVSDKPSQLRDGSPARETEFQAVQKGAPLYWFGVSTKKGDVAINVVIWSSGEKIGNDLKAIAYSLEFQAGHDEPAKVPPDVQEFLDKWGAEVVSHDVGKVMTYYSDRYLDSGSKKGAVEELWKQIIGQMTSFEVAITDFVPAGDRAYLAGFTRDPWGRMPLGGGTSIIKENGGWKWYGNQRDAFPSPW